MGIQGGQGRIRTASSQIYGHVKWNEAWFVDNCHLSLRPIQSGHHTLKLDGVITFHVDVSAVRFVSDLSLFRLVFSWFESLL